MDVTSNVFRVNYDALCASGGILGGWVGGWAVGAISQINTNMTLCKLKCE